MREQAGQALQLHLPGAGATEALGGRLARALAGRAGLLVFLRGDLGAGKTTLVRGWLRALGVTGPIRSPTYTLVEPYELPSGSVLHIDLYRLTGAAQIDQLGLADTPPEHSLWLVEWPERAAGRLPAPDLEIALQLQEDGRLAEVTPHGDIESAVRGAVTAT